MARKKKKPISSDPHVEEIVEVEIEYVCPKRGKVKQKVKMKKLKPIKVDYLDQIAINDSLADLEKQHGDDSSEEPSIDEESIKI